MLSKSRRKGAQIKKKRIPKYNDGGRPTNVTELLDYLDRYQGQTMVPTSDPYNLPVAQVNLPAAEVITDRSDPTYVNALPPERIARTEGDLAAVYRNLGSQGVTDYLDMTQGVVDAQNRFYEVIEPPLYFTPFGTPALINRMLADGVDADDLPSIVAAASSAAMRKMPSGPAVGGVLREGAEGVRNFFRRMMGKDPKYTARTSDIVGQPGRMASEMERFASGLTPEGAGRMDMLRRRPSSSGMFSAAEEAAMEAEILRGEEAVLGRRGLPPYRQGALPAPRQFPRLEESPYRSNSRATAEAYEMFEERGKKIPYSQVAGLTKEEMAEQFAPSGSELRSERFVELLRDEMRRQFKDVYDPQDSYIITRNKQQIPALMIGGELEKRANKQGMIAKDQMDQFVNKGGLSTLDRETLKQALAYASITTGKKGREFYNLNDIRRETAELLDSRFDYDETQTYSRYGFESLAGPASDVQDIGTQLIIADRNNPLAVNYIGANSGHWTGVSPDVVAHYRGFTRTGDDETLYIGEMQSDVAQRGRFLQSSSRYVDGLPRDLMATETAPDGTTRFTYRFPPDAYNTYLGQRTTDQATSPHNILIDAGMKFNGDDLAPNIGTHLSEIVEHGVISPDNAYLYDVNWWVEAQNKLRNLHDDYNGLTRQARRITDVLYTVAYNGYVKNNPNHGHQWAASGEFELPEITDDMAYVINDIVEALEANDLNPRGTFTDANIQSKYDDAIEKFKEHLERYEGTADEIAGVFDTNTLMDVAAEVQYQSPVLNEDLQKAFVKNQDEFLLSQIISQNTSYDVIRFPTGNTTAVIQGYTGSPRRVERQIAQTQASIDGYNDAMTDANTYIDNSVGVTSGFPSVAQNGQLTDFGRQLDALGPGVQQLLFGTNITSGGGTAVTDVGQYRNNTANFENTNFEQLRQDPSRTEFRIYNGTVDTQTQADVHMYNFLSFMNKLRNGRAGRAIAEGAELRFNEQLHNKFFDADSFGSAGSVPVKTNFRDVVTSVDAAAAEKLPNFMETEDASLLIEALVNSVTNFNIGNNIVVGTPALPYQAPRLSTDSYLDGSWVDHPAYEEYAVQRDAGGSGFHLSLSDRFSKYLQGQAYFDDVFPQFRASTEEVVDYYINNFVKRAGQATTAPSLQRNVVVEGNNQRLYGIRRGLGWEANSTVPYDMGQSPIHMPVASSSGGANRPQATGGFSGLFTGPEPTGYMMTEADLRQFLVNKLNELDAIAPGRTHRAGSEGQLAAGEFRRNISNLGDRLRVGARSSEAIGAQEQHIQGLQQQLQDIRNGVGVSDAHKTVMKSYDRLPKVAKKLGYNLKPVTDQHGNTWFELKMPAVLKDRSGEIRGYRYGGRVRVKKRKPMKVIKR